MSGQRKAPNRLSHETSPYLLQHADNPVGWYARGTGATEKAKSADKPIILTTGYAACHRGHVMEKESFANPDVVSRMNRVFARVTVEREERPDLDSICIVAPLQITIVDSDEHPGTRLMIDSIREFDIIKIFMMRAGGRETETALKKRCPGVPAFDLAPQRPQATVCADTAWPPVLEGPQALRSALTELQATQSSGGGR